MVVGLQPALTWSAARANTGWRFSWGSRRRDRPRRRRLPVTVPLHPETISLPARPAHCAGCTSSLPAPNACSIGPRRYNSNSTCSNRHSRSNRRRCPSSRCSGPARCPSNRRLRSTPAPIRPRLPWPRLLTTRKTRTILITRWVELVDTIVMWFDHVWYRRFHCTVLKADFHVAGPKLKIVNYWKNLANCCRGIEYNTIVTHIRHTYGWPFNAIYSCMFKSDV